MITSNTNSDQGANFLILFPAFLTSNAPSCIRPIGRKKKTSVQSFGSSLCEFPRKHLEVDLVEKRPNVVLGTGEGLKGPNSMFCCALDQGYDLCHRPFFRLGLPSERSQCTSSKVTAELPKVIHPMTCDFGCLNSALWLSQEILLWHLTHSNFPFDFCSVFPVSKASSQKDSQIDPTRPPLNTPRQPAQPTCMWMRRYEATQVAIKMPGGEMQQILAMYGFPTANGFWKKHYDIT